jgi:hypothetical protein
MDPKNREAVTSADDTGLIAGEELITEAETILPLERQLPHENLHAAIPPGHPAHSTIDNLRDELSGSAPDRRSIEKHVHSLRTTPELEAIVANWWDDPRTQRIIASLSQIGL